MKLSFTRLHLGGCRAMLLIGFLLPYPLHSSQPYIKCTVSTVFQNFHWQALSVQKTSLEPSILTQEDLPVGFEPAPALFKQFIMKSVAEGQADLEKENIFVRETSSFIDLEEAEMVICMVFKLPNSQARGNYDRRLNDPNAQKELEEGVQTGLGLLGKVTISEFKKIDSLTGLGEVAKGYQFKAQAEKLPVGILTEVLAFRRGGTGIVLIVSSVEDRTERIAIEELGLKLDRRLSDATSN